MIIVRLGGGLGNQMFQYALGKKLALQNKDTLLLDLSIFDLNKDHRHYRHYGLGHFNVTASAATEEQINAVKYPHGKLVRKIKNRFDKHIMRYRHVKFEPHILMQKGDIYLDGFWQSPEYFKDARATIVRDLSLKNPFSHAAQSTADAITREKNSVSLHLRRGDYTESKQNTAYFGTHCNQDYYSKALAHIADKKGDLSVFVFSDDVEWVKENIAIRHKTTYISEKSCPDYERLILMSLCEHHIIANSTFGWWSAWLDNKPGKIVVGPHIWTPGPRLPVDHILPPEWVRI